MEELIEMVLFWVGICVVYDFLVVGRPEPTAGERGQRPDGSAGCDGDGGGE